MAGDDQTAVGGLTAAEVARRVAAGQTNRAPIFGWAEYQAIVGRNVVTLFNALVVPAAVALFLLGDYRGAWAVSAMAVINTLTGLVQELRSKRHLDRLAILSEPQVRVRRDGDSQLVAARDVVLADHVLLAAGDAIVADGTLIEARFLEIDESLLTGESEPVARRAGDRLLSGSFCIAGDGVCRVDQVGAGSFVNQISAQARRYHYAPSPMQRTLDGIIRLLTAAALALCVCYVGLFYLRGFPRTDLWEMIAATVTSAIPQGLVLMTTLAFTLAALRMSARGAVVQRLNAVEAMASVEVLCLDKTGTLTTGQLSLNGIHAFEGYEDAARDWLHLFAWASMDAGNRSIRALRDGLGELPAGVKVEPVDQLPFKSQNRCSAVRLREGAVLVLGAAESLRSHLNAADVARVEAREREQSLAGLRVLLFAEAVGPLSFNGSLTGFTLRPLALVTLGDELRPEAGQVLRDLADQGVRFNIISGDSPETVNALVGRIGLPFGTEAVSGTDLASAPDPAEFLRVHHVFGRVTPKQKLDIINALQSRGQRVGMVGDGVNDVLAIKRANLGIAMGSGSSAARAVAGMVLEGDDFAVLPAALVEGRAILGHLRVAAKLFLLKNVYTLFLIVIGLGVLGLEFPYLPQQVTLLNTLTIGMPALLIVFDRRASGPRGASAGASFLREVVGFAVAAGLAVGVAGLAAWLVSGRWGGDELAARRTVLLSTLVLVGLGNVLVIAPRDARLWGWAGVAMLLYGAAMYIEPASYFFELTPLPAQRWLLVATAAAAAVMLCGMAERWVGRSKFPAAGCRPSG